jgi:hypothetical protein
MVWTLCRTHCERKVVIKASTYTKLIQNDRDPGGYHLRFFTLLGAIQENRQLAYVLSIENQTF